MSTARWAPVSVGVLLPTASAALSTFGKFRRFVMSRQTAAGATVIPRAFAALCSQVLGNALGRRVGQNAEYESHMQHGPIFNRLPDLIWPTAHLS